MRRRRGGGGGVQARLVPGRGPRHAEAVGAAVRAGVGYVVYTSVSRAGEPGNPVAVASDHGGTERVLAESWVAFTALRFNV